MKKEKKTIDIFYPIIFLIDLMDTANAVGYKCDPFFHFK